MSTGDKLPINNRESVHMKEAPVGARCEIHDWPDEGLGHRLIEAMRARHGMGGINVCNPCITRAREDAKKERNAKAK